MNVLLCSIQYHIEAGLYLSLVMENICKYIRCI